MKEYSMSLFAMLFQETKEELLRNARLLDLRISGNLRKVMVAHKMAEIFLKQPLWLLHRLPFREVLKLQKMVHSRDHAIQVRKSLVEDCITQIGLTDYESGLKTHKENIYPDLAEALEPVIDKYVSSLDPSSGKIRREAVVLGLLNLYGILTMKELTELCGSLASDMTPEALAVTVRDAYLLKKGKKFVNNQVFLTSPFLFHAEDILLEHELRNSLRRPRFTLEDVLAAGDPEIPQPPATHETGIFRQELRGIVKDEAEVDWWITYMWMSLNNESQPVNILGELMQECLMDEIQAKGFISIFMNWINHAPRWIFKGNSSKAVFERVEKPRFIQRPPTVVMGPGARKAGIDISQDEFNRMWENNVRPSGQKVGRNDPCPCGSGKKYKHCCWKIGMN